MKKSLLITFDFPPIVGGVSHSLWNFSQLFPAGSVLVLTQPSDIEIHAPFTIVRRRLLAPRFIWPRWLPVLWYLWKIVRQEHIEVIQVGQILPFGTAALILKKFFNISFVVYVYGQDLMISRNNHRKDGLIRSILRQANGVIANSIFTQQRAITLGAPRESTIVSYPYFPRFTNFLIEQHALEAFKINNNVGQKQILLTVGNLVYRKGHSQVLQALAKLKGRLPSFLYFIVGTGPELSRLQELIDTLGLSEQVVCTGKVPDDQLALYYASANVFIMPSRALTDSFGTIVDVEGFGMVFLEAASFSLPVIAGNTGGIPEAVVHEQTGLLVDPESVDQIAEAILRLFTDRIGAQKMGEAGKRRVEISYSAQREAASIILLLS